MHCVLIEHLVDMPDPIGKSPQAAKITQVVPYDD
jgi:hypothetical protein